MRTIRIKFEDFYQGWDDKKNYIYRALEKHYDVEFSDQPDYLFFGCFGDEHLKYDCVKVFVTGEDISPDFNLCDYGIAFDYIDFGDRYLRYPLIAVGNNITLAMEARAQALHLPSASKGFCSFVVSNGSANPIRETFFQRLSEYKTVASGGRFLNNVGGPVEDKIAFQRGYKFCIAFENEQSDGYTSEKILDAFKSGAVPIYWGNKRIEEEFNPESFINCNKFGSIDEAVAFVKRVDQDPALYEKYIKAPMFPNGKIPYKLTPSALEDFLCHIIDQPVDQAKRLSIYSRKRDYKSTQQEKARYYRLIHHNIIYRVIHKVVK